MASLGWQRWGWGGAERTALFFAPALWWPCTPVSLLFTLVSSILSHWVWGGACGNPTVTKGRSSPRQARAADHSPLDLGSVVKLPLKNSIALATIYLHRHKRKLCRLRCFSTKVCLGDIPYKGCRKWMLMGKGLLWTHNSLQRLQQQTRTAAFFKKKNTLLPAGPTCLAYVPHIFFGIFILLKTKWINFHLVVLSIKLNLGILGVTL